MINATQSMKDILPHWKTSLVSAAITVALTALVLGLVLGLAPEKAPVYNAEVTEFTYAAVQTTSTTCSKIGADILGRGHGSAVDAAVATQLCAGLVRPLDAGIGGGHVMTLYERYQDPSKMELVSILAREVAPLAATPSMFLGDSRGNFFGGLAVGVPGEVDGLYAAWRRYGRLPWAELVMPSIRLLEEGVPIEPYLAKQLQSEDAAIRATPALRSMFVRSDGGLRAEGDLYRNDRLLNTYRVLRFDPTSFYQGALADDVAADIRDAGGIVTKEDMARYQATRTSPQRAPLRSMNLTLYASPAPSGGPLVRFAVHVLDGFDFAKANIGNLDTEILADYVFIEALKFTFGEESLLSVDPDDTVMSEDDVQRIRQRITRQAASTSHYGRPYVLPDEPTGNTVCVLTAQGGAVALTSTLNSKLGSRVVGNRTGILFNNAMSAFSAVNVTGRSDHPANFMEPGKAPLSSMAPSLVMDENDKVVYVTGATGGPRGVSALVQVALRSVYFKQGLDAAVDNPRLHNPLAPNRLYHEGALSAGILERLSVRGQRDQSGTEVIGHVTVIRNRCAQCGRRCDVTDCVQSAVDGRSDGQAGAGY